MCRALFALVCAAALLVASDCQQQASDNAAVPIQELPSFSTVQACVPFNILIEPSGTSSGVAYGLQVEAEPQVASAIKATVGGDTLRLETGSFITRQPIKAVVYLPADRLLALDMLGFGANAYIAEGFRPSNFSLRLSSGTGGAFVFNMTTDSASVQTQSTGDVVLTGSYRTVTVSSSGISSLYVGGVTESADLQLSGISNVYVQPASDSVTIGGTASGISTVQYSQGQCAVQSAFLFTSPCEQTSSISLQMPVPSWTQGLTAVGSFSCGVAEGFLAPPQLLPSFQQPSFQFPYSSWLRLPRSS
ncbi:hypothetical protein D9Q98_005990 [Chlorella vulgaris]|uniref:Putative auto-transporter adhesin head GIN domain-containing protein n=1 Tax=Chlorella vulgaris TaxID=3077 RepID=A0A9D4Z0G3_CHLVU|nr:hypothetical protein D9Q98_005990 [Chlorella vulgaris]